MPHHGVALPTELQRQHDIIYLMLDKIKSLLKDPAFWDIFGLFTFSFILYTTTKSLSTNQPFSRPFVLVFFVIGIAGLLVDGQMVWKRWIKGEKE